MAHSSREFSRVAAVALRDERVQANLLSLYNGFHQGRQREADATPNWEEIRDRARAIKARTVENLDFYLELLERSVTGAGGRVFFATDAEAANR